MELSVYLLYSNEVDLHISVLAHPYVLVGVPYPEAFCLHNFKETGSIAIFSLPSN